METDSSVFMKNDPINKSQTDLCISIVNGETFDTIESQPLYAIKLKGVFSSEDDASSAAEGFRKKDKDHDILVGSVGTWLAFDSREKYTVNKYEQNELNEIMNPKKKDDAESSEKEEETEGDEKAESGESSSVPKEPLVTLQDLAQGDKDYLTIDKPIKNQTYFCFSYISGKKIATEKDDDKLVCFKIMGVFKTKEEAGVFANEYIKTNPHHDIYTSQVGAWVVLDQRPDAADRDSEADVNKLMHFIHHERLEQEQEFKSRLQASKEASNEASKESMQKTAEK